MKGLITSLLGEIAPKVAAPAAGASLLFPGQDAEAMPAAAFKAGVQHPIAQLRKQVAKNKQNGVSPEKTVTDWIHKNTNYEHIGKVGRKTEGMSGDWYKGQIDGIYEMLLDGADKDMMAGLDAWRGARMGRDSKHVMPHVAAAAGAAGLAGAGNASASDAGFPEWSRYEIGPSHGLPTPTWGDVGESVFNVLGAPMAGLQGLARGAYGLATGEDLVTAGAQAAHMMGSEYKGEGGLMTPGIDSAEGWKRYGDFTEDSFNKSGAVSPEIAKALGIVNRAPEFIVPF